MPSELSAPRASGKLLAPTAFGEIWVAVFCLPSKRSDAQLCLHGNRRIVLKMLKALIHIQQKHVFASRIVLFCNVHLFLECTSLQIYKKTLVTIILSCSSHHLGIGWAF